MPMMENPTPEQREALIKYWNWPGMAHPERDIQPKTDHLTMPFLYPKPSTKKALAEAQAKSIEEKATAAASIDTPVGTMAQPKSIL